MKIARQKGYHFHSKPSNLIAAAGANAAAAPSPSPMNDLTAFYQALACIQTRWLMQPVTQTNKRRSRNMLKQQSRSDSVHRPHACDRCVKWIGFGQCYATPHSRPFLLHRCLASMHAISAAKADQETIRSQSKVTLGCRARPTAFCILIVWQTL